MPEGPSILILKEAVENFSGKKIIAITGNSKIEQARLANKKILSFKSWGKHFLICFRGFTVRIHFLLFGSYLVNEKKDRPVRLSLSFASGEINFYACAIKIIEGDADEHYDWTVDVMNDHWDKSKAATNLKSIPKALVCDALLKQEIFSGVGNIIKNEVLFRVKVHPESVVGNIPAKKQREIIKEARVYTFQFLTWKKNYELKKHWLAHTKKICPRCDIPFVKKYTGITNRRSFFCECCQHLY